MVGGGCLRGGGGHVSQGDMHGREACVAGKMATAADETHPTGMHSCFSLKNVFENILRKKIVMVNDTIGGSMGRGWR